MHKNLLEIAKIDFEMIKEVTATYHEKALKSKEVGFFQIGDLLLSVVAVKELNQLTLSKFSHYLRYFNFRIFSSCLATQKERRDYENGTKF